MYEQYKDLQFLLSPHPCDGSGKKVLQLVGQQLTNLRETKKFSRSDIAQAIGEPVYRLANVENGNVLRYGMTFQTYVKYAHYFGTTLLYLINTGIAEEKGAIWKEDGEDQMRLSVAQMGEDELFVRVIDAVEQIRRDGKPLTKMSIIKLLRIHPNALSRYQRIREFVEQIIVHPTHKRGEVSEHELVYRVQVGINSLKMRGMRISQLAVAKTSQLDPAEIRHCREAKALIEHAVKECRTEKFNQQEEELISHIQVAFRELYSSGEAITRSALSKKVHVALSTIRRYTRAFQTLEKLVNEQERKQLERSEEEILARVQLAMRQLEANKQRVTFVAICQLVQMPLGSLRKYDRIKVVLEQVKGKPNTRRLEYRQRRENDLVVQVQNAIDYLKYEHEFITQIGISKMVRMAVSNLRKYPRVREMLDKVIKDAPTRRKQSILQREETLIRRIDMAIKDLQTRGERVTQQSVARTLHVPVGAFSRYAKVKLFLEQETAKSQVMQFQHREKEILKSIELTIEHLETQKEPLSVSAIAARLQLSVGALLYYPQVVVALKFVVRDWIDDPLKATLLQRERRISLIKQTIQDLTSSGISLSYQAISEATGISKRVLRRRGPVRAMIEEALADSSLLSSGPCSKG